MRMRRRISGRHCRRSLHLGRSSRLRSAASTWGTTLGPRLGASVGGSLRARDRVSWSPGRGSGSIVQRDRCRSCPALGRLPPRRGASPSKSGTWSGIFCICGAGGLPQRGHLEVSGRWGWPRVGGVGAALAVETRNRADRIREQWMPLVCILDGAWVERSLTHLAAGVRHDERWQGLPAAMHLRASVAGGHSASAAVQIVAEVPDDEWVKQGRTEKEQYVTDWLQTTWVERAVAARMRKVLSSSEEAHARNACVSDRAHSKPCVQVDAGMGGHCKPNVFEFADNEPQGPR